MAPPLDEAVLVAALIAKEPAAAGVAWDVFSPLVRALLWQTLGSKDGVDDLTQEVFLHLFRRIGALRDPEALRSFVVGITIRVARNELRRLHLRRWLRLTDDGDVPEEATSGEDYLAREAVRRIYAILDRLDYATRITFVLRYVQGLELAEVAETLGTSLATVKRRIARVHERIVVHARKDASLAHFLHRRGADGEDEDDRPSPTGTGNEGR